MLPTTTRRFHAESLFRPQSVAVIGAATALGATILGNLRRGGFEGVVTAVDAAADIAALPSPPDLAVIATADAAPALEALARRGTFAAIHAAPCGPVAAPSPGRCRVMGPSSFGVIVPALGLNASSSHVQPRPGKLSLAFQSAALCRAVLDWAEPNGVGFSHVVGVGDGADIGFDTVLDWLARDPGTGAILLDIRTIRDRRAFLSAARAAARLRPVVAIHPGGRMHDPSGRADDVFTAALHRAGILRVSRLEDLLAAAETLTRARPPRTDAVLIVTNATGPAQMAADEAQRLGVPLAAVTGPALGLLRLHLPPQPEDPGLVWTGADRPTRLAEAAAMLSAIPEVGGVVAVMAPTGDADAAGIAAMAAALPSLKIPLLACVLGETTGAAHRRDLAAAGIPVFATPEQAMRGFAQLTEQRRARAAARELPSSAVLRLAPDHVAVQEVFRSVRQRGRSSLLQDEALAVLSAYGMPVVPSRGAMTPGDAADAATLLGFPVVLKLRRGVRSSAAGPGGIVLDLPDAAAVRRVAERLNARLNRDGLAEGFLVQRQVGRARALRISAADDPLFGPAIGFGQGGSAAELLDDVALDLPPLNLALAASLVARTRAAGTLDELRGQPAADRHAVADALVRISQLLLDFPEIAELEVNPLFADADGVSAAGAWIRLRPAGEQAQFAIAPYPAELAERWMAGDEPLLIRPIRPEDAAAHAALFRRLSPEDVRFRFFSMLRDMAPEQIARMTQVDYDREMAFVAIREATGETVGVSRLVREPGAHVGEFAIVLEPGMKGRGLGRRLMQRLIEWGRAQGLREITGQVLADNAPMLAFIRRVGFVAHHVPGEADVVEVAMPLE